jgi:DNA-binding IclR family transcriptional regulator
LGKEESPVQSISRAVSILRTFTVDAPELGVTEISQRVGLQKSTTFRLLSALRVESLVAQNPETGRYRLGVGLIELAGRVAVHADVRQMARRHMHLLSNKIGATVTLAVLEGDTSINLEQSMPRRRTVVNYDWVGQRLPLHATSTGKVLLAWLDTKAMEEVLIQPLEAYTPRTITDIETLEMELTAVQKAGYSVEHEEYEVGLNAVAAPVRDHTGRVVAVISASGPSYRLPPENFEEIAQEVIATTKAISTELGYMANTS